VPSMVLIESPSEWGVMTVAFGVCIVLVLMNYTLLGNNEDLSFDWFFEGLRRVIRYGMQTTFLDGQAV